MTLRRALMVLCLTAIAALSGCGDEGGSDPNVRIGPPGAKTYVVTGVTEDGTPRPLVSGTEIRIRFGDGRITLTAGCNTMSGTYALDGTRLTVESLATTDMGCDQDRMGQDTWLAGLFTDTVQFMAEGDATIVSGSTVLALADRETVSPDKPLVGTKWVLDSIGSGGADGAVSSVPQGVVAWFTLAEDGTLLANDGCNGGAGSATVSGDTISWGGLTLDLKACVGGGVDEVSKVIHEVLTGETTFTIEEKVLTITKGDRFLGFRAG